MRYRLKSEEFEAVQYKTDGDEQSAIELIQFLQDAVGWYYDAHGDSVQIVIPCPGRELRASPGDWIVKDAAGGLYFVYSPEEFEAEFEPAPSEDPMQKNREELATNADKVLTALMEIGFTREEAVGMVQGIVTAWHMPRPPSPQEVVDLLVNKGVQS